jgi:hypothetical protein
VQFYSTALGIQGASAPTVPCRAGWLCVPVCCVLVRLRPVLRLLPRAPPPLPSPLPPRYASLSAAAHSTHSAALADLHTRSGNQPSTTSSSARAA